MTLEEMQVQSKAQFNAKVLADSVNVCGNRLTTFELTYPRCIHSECLTHRVFSKNAASSRAIPVKKMLEAVERTPFVPFHWGKNQSGMQANEVLDEELQEQCRHIWVSASMEALSSAQYLNDSGLHKQIANRLLEPFMFITVILSTSSFKHFELLRNHSAAEPHFQYLAQLMAKARQESIPELLQDGQWHLPLIYEEDRSVLSTEDLKKVSTARCAAVSYVRHNERKDYAKDFELHDRLAESKHLSPFEHVATPWVKNMGALGDPMFVGLLSGNFYGWKQYRKEIDGEFVLDEFYTGPTR